MDAISPLRVSLFTDWVLDGGGRVDWILHQYYGYKFSRKMSHSTNPFTTIGHQTYDFGKDVRPVLAEAGVIIGS